MIARRRALPVLIGGLLLATVAAGCGDSTSSASPVAVSASVTSPAPSDDPSPTESPTESPSMPETPLPTDGEPTEPTDSETPAVLPPEAANRPLTLSSVFKYPDGWRDGRYEVADRKQATGISGQLNGCGDLYAQVLELRLANNFSRLKLEFGQSNSSESSDQILQVRIDANGQYRDQKAAKLNQIAAFDLPVPKVNALKIIVSLKESDGCDSGLVEAVLMNVVLS
jgi:hypothetical protein